MKQPKPPKNPNDAWLDFATEQVAKDMIDWLKHTVNTKRAICSLEPAELKALAGCAIARYCIEQGRRTQTQKPYPPAIDLLV